MTRRSLAMVTLAWMALSVGGCSTLVSTPSAEVGECVQMDGLQSAQVDEIPTVDCGQEHDGQVVHKFDAPDGDYPDTDEWQTIIREGCIAGFEDYVGQSYEESTIDLQDLSPTEDGWKDGDRSVLCIGYLSGETTTESFEGSQL